MTLKEGIPAITETLTRRLKSFIKLVKAHPWRPRGRKYKSFLAPIRSQNGGDRLELVW